MPPSTADRDVCRHGTRGLLIFQMRSCIAHDRPGNAVLEQGRTGEAIRQFQEAIRCKPDLASAQSNPAQALELKGKSNAPLKPQPAQPERVGCEPELRSGGGHSGGWHRPPACAGRRPAARNGKSPDIFLNGCLHCQRPASGRMFRAGRSTQFSRRPFLPCGKLCARNLAAAILCSLALAAVGHHRQRRLSSRGRLKYNQPSRFVRPP